MTKRMYNTFEFVGKLNFGAEPIRVNKFESGWTTKELSLIINDSDTNGQFVKINSGMHVDNGKPNIVYKKSKQVFGQPSADLQIPWEDRLNQTVVNSIPDYMKIVVDLTEDKESLKEYYNKKREIYQLESKSDNVTQEDENKLQELYDELVLLAPQRKEFLHAEDVITYLTEEGNLDKYKGKKFKVKGNIEKSYSQKNNKFYTNYVWNTIELVSDDTPSKLSAQLDLFFVKGAEDKSSFKEDKVLYFDTYIIGRDNTARKDVFFPHQVVLNASKLDLENEDHLARLQFIRDIFDVIKQSITLLNEVRYAENTKNITFCDSALKAGEQQLKMLKSQFNYYKDQYMDHGMYIPKNYPLDNALGTNSLRSAVEETGDMFIESVLSNRSINHNQLKITRNDTTFVETNKVTADGLNYKVGNYEIVRFTAKDENGLAKFIYSFQNEPLSLTFIGNKTVTTQMSQASKKGIALSYELYNLMKQMNELTIEKQKSLALIDYLETKKSKEEK